jgi:hypothetical protein
MNTTSNVNA